MNTNYWELAARKPRHQANRATGVRVQIERDPTALPALVEAELLDLSRSGIRLRSAVPLVICEPITVRLLHEASGIDMPLPATLRWQRPEPDATWLMGYEFDAPVDWISLGELFLNRILADDLPDRPAGG